MEENNVQLAITPFEKNVEIWRQLWRVIEKSDLLLQIVDARNPYFFYCPDLE
jgi:large subunit GTPase 1